ncbi:tRNA lysidine(34) synthetase TilS [Hydrogenophaga sp. PBL-H3]|uniref:tRNA lysidine(34) synthetase TilS n=1 Tax=Hydrogenophaga sp. PBL-H3 TaxID=434010 RepID=UPI001F1B1591|nr:tRNA lysidine(34) synthetase TilS [Hydrogenophaga sp. PBL-H3]
MARWCDRCASNLTTVAVAYSAGADSTALLLAAHRRWPARVVALHVHHGLHAAADGFESHARRFCGLHGIELRVDRVNAAHDAGQSPEDAARLARYAALASMARDAGADGVLLGQHADDQAETLLLALSRGAGLPGLASMPEFFERAGMRFGRPLLDVPASELRAWLLAQGHAFVDDPTNTDERFTRNRIRAVLMPAWDACFPGFRPMLARSARHAAQAQRLLDELAAFDLAHTGMPPKIARLQSLSRDRQANAVRYWLRISAAVAPATAQLDELLDQISACTTRGHRIHIKMGPGHVAREGEHLQYTPTL